MTTQHPYFEFAPNTYEIDEFDCASVFVLVGEKRAMVIDTGIGIGDLMGVIRKITDKPLDLVMTHGHGDHTGGCRAFDAMWMHPADWDVYELPPSMEMRKGYAAMIAKREHKNYAYSLEDDFADFEKVPDLLPLEDGQVFDLGGRMVTAYHCPGHTPGEMVFIDHQNRILFCGDACNCNLMLSSPPDSPAFVGIKKAGEALRQILDMKDQYDRVYNSHHDFRGLGAPLADNVLPDAVACCEELVAGTARIVEVPDPMAPGTGKMRTVAQYGDVMIAFHPNGII